MKTFKSNCGCEIHVIKWSVKANSVTTQMCPLHKAAPKLLEELRNALRIFTRDNVNASPDQYERIRSLIAKAESIADNTDHSPNEL